MQLEAFVTGEQLAAGVLAVAATGAAVRATVGLVSDLAVLSIGVNALLLPLGLALGVAVVVLGRGRLRARAALSGAMTGRAHAHAHGGGTASARQRMIGRHEVGHVAAAEATGMGVSSVRIGDGWGYVQASRFVSVKSSITFLAAGHLAVGTKSGASSDLAAIRDLARNLPRETRSQDLHAAIADAWKIVGAQSGRIRRDGHRLADTGRW